MRLKFKYPVLFSLMMILGMILGYKIDSKYEVSQFPIEIFDTIQKHYIRPVNAFTLQLTMIQEVLSQLDSSSKFQRMVKVNNSFSKKNLPVLTTSRLDKERFYLKLSSVSHGAYQIVAEKLDSITSSGTKKIIFDLRGVSGDSFDDAIQIADEFLSGDQLITFTLGAHQVKREFRAQRPGLFEQGELLVLIDSLTRGPSEVICAAIKFWKRGKLIGRRTAGRTIELERFSISNKYELVIPILKYYSPEGLSITKSNNSTDSGGVLPDIVINKED